MEIEISEGLYELLMMQSAESGLTVEELISFVFGNYMEHKEEK